jgi:hypothetical protein
MKTLLLIAALAAAPSLALAQDLAGVWTISSSVRTTPITVSCTLVRKAGALTGTCTPAGGEPGPEFSVEVKGTHASWGYDVTFRGQLAHVGYEADIASDTSMSGALKLGANAPPSPFTAVKTSP